ncbi:amidase signature enzyme [Exidia glandulosa HHB12029]|uniref:amidase n=1 Tax=Exidia glandulosa HHB12029 TaxID=1314781 RepID=A0A165HRB6_EXIGL|nr:amidase signature enzyme [Exidia glandulosa HHB12029]
MWPFSNANWKETARAKQDVRAAAVDAGLATAGPATSDDNVYLGATACHIAQQIKTGQWSAGQVVRAYVRRAGLAQSRFNCFTEVRFKEAIQEADALDAEFATSKTPRGRFHGVPLSIKEQFDLAGYDSSNGYTAWTTDPALEDAGLVEILRSEGAIVLGKTNIGQTLMFFESVNPVFGRTSNPWNDKHTCGGSSGGEGALLAADGSAFGIGTDIGGSLRIPAFYCGIYSLKPTLGRISRVGLKLTAPGLESIPLVSGPMGRSVEDVDAVARIAFGRPTRGWESLPPVPYTEFKTDSTTRLRFGYYTFDGCIRSSPATQRAVLETVAALRGAGHEVVEFTPPSSNTAAELFVGLVAADGYSTMLKPLASDPQMDELFLITLGPKLPGFIRSVVGWLVSKLLGDEHFRDNIMASRKRDVAGLYKLIAARDEYTKLWYKEVWDAHGFDGLVVPSQAIPAPPHGATKLVPQLSVSTFLWNILDFPTGAVPVTRVDPTVDTLTPEWLASGPRGGIMVERTLYHGSKPLYDAKAMSGLPVGVQIVGRRWQDEKVLAMMRIADDALGKRSFGPGSWTP